MGRWSYSYRIKDTNCLKLNIFWLRRQGSIRHLYNGIITWTSGWSKTENRIGYLINLDEGYIELDYSIVTDPSNPDKVNYRIPLTKTPCRFGGLRYWFRCPGFVRGSYCGRRCAVLYKDGKYFLCRKCNRLLYDSQFETKLTRFHGVFKLLKYESKIESLMKDLKRRTYRGKPTRKMKRVLKLYNQSYKGMSDLDDLSLF